MKVGLLNKIQGRTKVLSVVGLASLVMVSAGIQNNSIKSQKLSSLKGGLQTCFTRLHNSYTARLLGAESEYLANGFTQKTEECLGETINAYEAIGLNNTVILDDLNTLANDANWFHQKITTKESNGLFEGNPENVLLNALGGRFEKLEVKKIQVNDAIRSLQNALNARKGTMSTFFYLIAAFVPIFLGIDYLKRRADEEALEEISKESNRLLSEDGISLSTVKPLILKSLNVMGLGKLAQLFEVALIREQADLNRDISVGVQVPAEDSRVARNEQIEEIWTRPASSKLVGKVEAQKVLNPQYVGEEVELEERIASVVDLLSAKVFTMGINLDIKSEEIKVYAEEEALDQVIYHVLSNAIDNYNFEDPKKYLSINVKQLGAHVFLDIFDSGRQFSKEFLRQSKGLATGILEHTDLAIAQSLAGDMRTKISFDNVDDGAGEHVGRKVQIVFTAVEDRNQKSKSWKSRRAHKNKQVTRIEKGTKKDLLRRMHS